MNLKSGNSTEEWVDPDDAPELDDEFFEEGVWSIGGAVATREEVQAAWARDAKKAADETSLISSLVRLDNDVLLGFEALGADWQTRLNEVLRQWLRSRRS